MYLEIHKVLTITLLMVVGNYNLRGDYVKIFKLKKEENNTNFDDDLVRKLIEKIEALEKRVRKLESVETYTTVALDGAPDYVKEYYRQLKAQDEKNGYSKTLE